MTKDKPIKSSCLCRDPEAPYSCFDRTFIGIDEEKGRFGEVSLLICRTCGERWLNYLLELEGIPHSGRWFRGLIDENTASVITPVNARDVLEGLDWFYYGGSYFNSKGRTGTGTVMID